MAQSNEVIPLTELIDPLTLTDLCRICDERAEWIIELVEEGILEPEGPGRRQWRFESACIARVRKVQRLQSDLRINIAGVAVVLNLVEENTRLRRQLRHFERDLSGPIPMPEE